MVAPLVAAAGIAAGAGILGGIFDRSAGRKAQAHQDAREDSRFQRASVDAKAAGLHPLFALGASGAGSPQFIAGQSQSGSALGDAVRGVGRVGSAYQRSKIPSLSPLQQRLAELQVENAEVVLAGNKLDLVERQANLSSNQQVTQAAAGSQEIPVVPPAAFSKDMSKYEGVVEPTPTKIVTSAPGSKGTRTAGVKPGWDLVKILPWAKPMLVPQSEEGWGDDLTIMKFAVIAAANAPSMAKFLVMLNVKTIQEGMKVLKEGSRRLNMGKAYKRAVTTPEFRKRVDSTKSTRKRIY